MGLQGPMQAYSVCVVFVCECGPGSSRPAAALAPCRTFRAFLDLLKIFSKKPCLKISKPEKSNFSQVQLFYGFFMNDEEVPAVPTAQEG